MRAIQSGLSAGEYKIEMGMYLLSAMERLWMVGGDGQAEKDCILLKRDLNCYGNPELSPSVNQDSGSYDNYPYPIDYG